MFKICLIDDDKLFCHLISEFIKEHGFDVDTFTNPAIAWQSIQKKKYDLFLVDYHMPELDGIEFLIRLKEKNPDQDVILMSTDSSIECAVKAMKEGANDYLCKPFSPDNLLSVVRKIIEKQNLLKPQKVHSLNLHFNNEKLDIIGQSEKIKHIFEIISKVAPTDSTVLIMGESGTGKELVAKAIHANSQRRDNVFFGMDCGSLVESLFESELFGHVKGSFTGATTTKHGAFELADKGTFFFDEIGNISMNVQAKILRAIQEKEIRPVGSDKSAKVDVRVIAATNLDLRRAVQQNKFREDLYYRLSVIPIYLSPLRERLGDIPLLVDFFIQKNTKRRKSNKNIKITKDALELLKLYSWPGNVRELQNVIERAVLMNDSSTIDVANLPEKLQDLQKIHAQELLSLADVEKQHIERVLKATHRNISRSSRILGIDRKTLYDKIKKYRLS